MVREDSVRTILFDLDNVAQSVGAGDPNSPNAVKLISIYHNLLRRWAEV
jgi:PKHD-type hydroxylase